MIPRHLQWTVPSLLFNIRMMNRLVYKGPKNTPHMLIAKVKHHHDSALLGLVARKLVSSDCDQVRSKPAWSASQTSSNIKFLHAAKCSQDC